MTKNKSFPLFRDISRGHPSGGDTVCPLSLLNVEDLLDERPFQTLAKQNPTGTEYRCQSRNGPVLVEHILTVICD